jgi:hypothetical protein
MSHKKGMKGAAHETEPIDVRPLRKCFKPRQMNNDNFFNRVKDAENMSISLLNFYFR